MSEFDTAFDKIGDLVERFERDRAYYCSASYNEASVRKEFINPFFKALGWDVENKQGLPPAMREVMVEEGETSGTPDYAFRLNGQTKFFVEAKKPSESLDNVKHILQAKSYAWNSKTVFISALTDFEETKLYDASLKPDPKAPERGLIWSLKFTEYLDNLDKLEELSKEKVLEGSLERLLLRDKESKRLRIPVDEAFLQQLTVWREELAKSYKKHTPDLDVYTLNEIVQRLLDRLVFVRICEDRRIVPARSMEELARYWREEGQRRDLMTDHLAPFFHKLNERFNGEILQPHGCEIYKLDSDLLAKIIDKLYFPSSPYQFNIIGVEILGTIYERYLGKTLHVTPKQAKLEDKPEVRKAGGVYYTPSYIVQYIVKNTVGKLLEKPGFTPEDVSKLRILDPACGSGSFLLEAYDKLLEWHLEYYKAVAKAGKQSRMIGAADLPYFTDVDGEIELTAAEKARILTNNIYGVDIDPQAVEIAMMSLYIKLLEGEVHFPSHRQILPHLKRNLRCGNSLIGPDFYEQQGDLFDTKESRRINAFDWYSKEHGFGEIMALGGFDAVIGNPPYGAGFSKAEKTYFQTHFGTTSGRFESYWYFLEKATCLLKEHGYLGYIVPDTWFTLKAAEKLRRFLFSAGRISELIELHENVFKQAKVDVCLITYEKSKNKGNTTVRIASKNHTLEDFAQHRFVTEYDIDQTTWLSAAEARISLSLSPFASNLVERIACISQLLGSIAIVTTGPKPYQVGKGIPPQTKHTLASKPFTAQFKKDRTFRIMLRGEDISRYSDPTGKTNEWLSYGEWLAEVRNPLVFNKPRLLIQSIRNPKLERRIVATFANDNSVNNNSITNVVVTDEEPSIFYILGILNSALINWFFAKSYNIVNIDPRYLKLTPIRTIDFKDKNDKAMHDRMVELVELMLKLNKELHGTFDKGLKPLVSVRVSERDREALERRIDYTDSEIDKLVYKLYDLTDEEIKIVEGG